MIELTKTKYWKSPDNDSVSEMEMVDYIRILELVVLPEPDSVPQSLQIHLELYQCSKWDSDFRRNLLSSSFSPGSLPCLDSQGKASSTMHHHAGVEGPTGIFFQIDAPCPDSPLQTHCTCMTILVIQKKYI